LFPQLIGVLLEITLALLGFSTGASAGASVGASCAAGFLYQTGTISSIGFLCPALTWAL